MRVLLDTHVLMWMAFEPGRLRSEVRAVLDAETTEVMASAVSLWEVAIKTRLGRLGIELEGLLGHLAPYSKVRLLSVSPAHVVGLSRLAVVEKHGDPFDHMLIAQAIAEDMTLVSADGWMRAYPVSLMRA